MSAELTVLVLSTLLLFAHVLLAAHYKTKQYGAEWNTGARDEDLPPLNAIAGRLDRARGNFLETYPVAIVAIVAAVLSDKANGITAIAAWIWLGTRLVYLPLYWAGVPVVRTLVWGIGLLALLSILGIVLLG